MTAIPLVNMIHVAKAACLIDTKEQCAIAWERVEEVSAYSARTRTRVKPNRTVIFNNDKLDRIKKNTLKIRSDAFVWDPRLGQFRYDFAGTCRQFRMRIRKTLHERRRYCCVDLSQRQYVRR